MKRKRITAILLSAAMILSFAACSGNSSENSSNTSKINSSQNENSISDNSDKNSESSAENKSDDSDNSEDNSSEIKDTDKSSSGKTLVIYFSANNSKDIDTISSATPVTDNTAATQKIAEIIHDNVGGDIVKIIPSKAYPIEYNDVADHAKSERDNNERPKFEDLGVNIEDYDTVYIGYPIWWYTVPMIIETFFDNYDFSGKTIIPFNTHAGSRDGGTYDTIKELEPNAVVLDGLAVSGGNAFNENTEQEVKDWLSGNN